MESVLPLHQKCKYGELHAMFINRFQMKHTRKSIWIRFTFFPNFFLSCLSYMVFWVKLTQIWVTVNFTQKKNHLLKIRSLFYWYEVKWFRGWFIVETVIIELFNKWKLVQHNWRKYREKKRQYWHNQKPLTGIFFHTK